MKSSVKTQNKIQLNSLKVASWNIEGRLTDTGAKSRGSSAQIIDAIRQLNADVLVLLEAHSQISLDDLKLKQQLIDMGYYLYNTLYKDDMHLRKDAYTPQLSSLLLSKTPVETIETFRLGNVRNAFTAIVKIAQSTQKLRVIGVHLDDRQESTRLKQIDDLSKIINQSDLPTVVLGDFNAMHGDDLWPAKFLRSQPIRLLASLIWPRIFLKVVGMATGDSLRLLQSSTNLHDADTRHQPTTTPKLRGYEWLPSIRLIQIDHMFISPGVQIQDFRVQKDGGADHRAIVATLLI